MVSARDIRAVWRIEPSVTAIALQRAGVLKFSFPALNFAHLNHLLVTESFAEADLHMCSATRRNRQSDVRHCHGNTP
jgi:hypothetical protein